MTVESIAEFYRETVIGQVLRDVGREEGREDLVTALLKARFGDDAQISEIAPRLVEMTPDEAVQAINRAGSLAELAGPKP